MCLIHTCFDIQGRLCFQSNISNRLSRMKNKDPHCLKPARLILKLYLWHFRTQYIQLTDLLFYFHTKQQELCNQHRWEIINQTLKHPESLKKTQVQNASMFLKIKDLVLVDLKTLMLTKTFKRSQSQCGLAQVSGHFLWFVDYIPNRPLSKS